MELKHMYAPQKDSPTTFLLGAINSTDTFVIVGNSQILPSTLPFPLTLGPDKTVTETVMVTEVNLDNNRIVFERGPGALPWPSGTTVARTFNADDLQSVQENIVGINSEVETSKSDISGLTSTVGELNTVVGNADSGLIKGLADEVIRATGAEAAETLRATEAENALNSSKINRSELPQILIDASYSADATKLTTTLSRYNASNQQSGTYDRTLPLVSSNTVGVMTPEAYNEITSLRNDVMALQQQGGKFIGLSFATKSALDSYIVPSSVKAGDFTYVIDDETKDDSTTRYVFNGATFDFAFVVNYDPVGIANTEAPGIVKSSDMMVWTSRTSAADNSWRSVCYGNGLFVAVASSGTGNRIMTSPDGINWTIRTSAADNAWYGVCYGNGLFVAVASSGTNNRVMTSPDGINWTVRTSAADNAWYGVCYGNGLFVAVANSGTGNRVMTSPDGINWTSRTSAADNAWNSVCYGNGLFVAVGNGGVDNRVMTSPDGINWTSGTSAADEYWRSVCYGNGLFVAVSVSSQHLIMTSPDGINWTAKSNGPSGSYSNWYSVCYGNGLFVAVGAASQHLIMTSPDGINWTFRTCPANNGWYSVCYGNGLFIAVAGTGTNNRVMTSPTDSTGKIFVEMDGTMSLVGWDNLMSEVVLQNNDLGDEVTGVIPIDADLFGGQDPSYYARVATTTELNSQLAQDVLNLNTHTSNSTNAHGVDTRVSKTGDTMTGQLNVVKVDSSGFVALRIENGSIDANTTKFMENRFAGRDTVNTLKDCAYIRVTPSNVNWLGSNLEFYTRTNDANPNLKMKLATNGVIEFSSNNIGNPEGVVAAPVGSIYLRADGGNATLYVKQSGTGNMGWVAK